jgi:4'-phosphopantetheinyl transferase
VLDPVALASATDDALAAVPDGWSLLTEAERERATAFRLETDRRDFVAAHLVARVCAARVLGTEASEITVVQVCPTCGGPHGPPHVEEAPELGLSLAHTKGYVAAVAGAAPVGVDVESLDGIRLDPELLERVLTVPERAALDAAPDPRLAFARLWVRKEALVKLGELTLDDLATADVSGRALLEWVDEERQTVGAAAATTTPTLGSL